MQPYETDDRTNAPMLYTAKEVASRLRMRLSTVYHLAKMGRLPAVRIDRVCSREAA